MAKEKRTKSKAIIGGKSRIVPTANSAGSPPRVGSAKFTHKDREDFGTIKGVKIA